VNTYFHGIHASHLTEHTTHTNYILQSSGRFAHAKQYIKNLSHA